MKKIDNLDETLCKWIWKNENSLETLTKPQFLENFKKNFMAPNNLTNKDMEAWAEGFMEFLGDNRTFLIDPERSILLHEFDPYRN